MEYHQWSETSATLWPSGEVKERGERREHVSTLKTLENEPISPLPPKLRPKSTRSPNLRIASHKDIFSPSFPFLSLTQKTSIDLFLRHGAETSRTPHHVGSKQMRRALYKAFTVTHASRSLNLEKSTPTDQFNLDSAIPVKDLLEP